MHPRFQTAFAQLADNLQSALEPILADKYFPALLTGEQVSSLKSATARRRRAGIRTTSAGGGLCAYAIVEFNVGAIARCERNSYFGANMEFIARQCSKTVHAEQSDQPRPAEW